MAKAKIAQSKRTNKRTTEQPVDAEIRRAAERAGIPVAETARSSSFELTGEAPFNGDEGLRKGITVAELFAVLFDASNGHLVRSGKDVDGFIKNVVLCAIDDLDILESANVGELVNIEAFSRFISRMGNRLHIGLEVARRMRLAGEVAS